MSSGKATTPEISAFLRAVLKERVERGETARAIAQRAGLTETQISHVRHSERGVGYKSVQGLCKAFGLTLAQAEQLASRWGREDGPPSRLIEKQDRYPNRARAVEAASSEFPEEAIHRVESYVLKSSNDPPVSWWYDQIRYEARHLGMVEAPFQVQLDREQTEREIQEMIRRTSPKFASTPINRVNNPDTNESR